MALNLFIFELTLILKRGLNGYWNKSLSLLKTKKI